MKTLVQHFLASCALLALLLILGSAPSAEAASPLSDSELRTMVASGMTDAQIAAEVRQRKVSTPSAQSLADALRARGAGPAAVAAVLDPANLTTGQPTAAGPVPGSPTTAPPPPPPRPKAETLTSAQARALGESVRSGGAAARPELPARIPFFRTLTSLRAGWQMAGNKHTKDAYLEFYARSGSGAGDLQRLAVGTVTRSATAAQEDMVPAVAEIIGMDWDLQEISKGDRDSIVLMRPKLTITSAETTRVALLRQRTEGDFLLFVLLISKEKKVTDFEQSKWIGLVRSFDVTEHQARTATP